MELLTPAAVLRPPEPMCSTAAGVSSSMAQYEPLPGMRPLDDPSGDHMVEAITTRLVREDWNGCLKEVAVPMVVWRWGGAVVGVGRGGFAWRVFGCGWMCVGGATGTGHMELQVSVGLERCTGVGETLQYGPGGAGRA
eukprot:11950481-Alexandrium_andersonii.AAC.1